MKAIKWIVLGFIFLGIVYCSVHCLQQKAILERTKVTQDVLDLFATKKTLETATVKISRTFSGEQDISQLIPGVGIDDITHSPLFRYTMTLPVEAVVRAGFRLDTL